MRTIKPAPQSSTVDLVTLLLVLAGDHQASARANARALLRLAEAAAAVSGAEKLATLTAQARA